MGAEHGDAEYSIKLLNMSEAELREAASKLDDLRLWVEREERSPEWMQGMHAVYKNDPDSWDVITGKMSQEEWVERRQQEQQQAQREKKQRIEALEKQLEKLYYDGPLSIDEDGNLTRDSFGPWWQDEIRRKGKSMAEKILERRIQEGWFPIDEDGNLVQDPSASWQKDMREMLKTPIKGSVENISILDSPKDSPKIYRAPDQPKMVPSFRDNNVPIFAQDTQFLGTTVGGRNCAASNLSLTQEQQEAIYRMCKIAGVDYYLVLATIAHESNSDPEAKNDSGTKGWMQVSGTAWNSYTQKGGEYYSDDRTQEIYDAVREKEGEEAFKDVYDPLSNAAAGIAQYYVW